MAEKENPDVIIVEIGGTVGDIESLPFLEAIRQMGNEEGAGNTLFVHVTLVPHRRDKLKRERNQRSTLGGKKVRQIGIARFSLPFRKKPRSPMICVSRSLSCSHQRKSAVISALDVDTIYDVPLAFHEQGLDELIVTQLGFGARASQSDLSEWRDLVGTVREPSGGETSIAIVGKYVELEDSYKSLREALTHGGVANNLRVSVKWIESEDLMDDDYESRLRDFDAILVPGGFGKRGIAGMIRAITYARKSNTPYFGICLGMQTACIEYARNVCGLKDADSTEFDSDSPYPIIFKLRDLVDVEEFGGTMRLGACPLRPFTGSLAQEIYGAEEIGGDTGIVMSLIRSFAKLWSVPVWCLAVSLLMESSSR